MMLKIFVMEFFIDEYNFIYSFKVLYIKRSYPRISNKISKRFLKNKTFLFDAFNFLTVRSFSANPDDRESSKSEAID
jgi:hypothetical protein